ncbi:MAG: glycosyltransferase family 2 protein [Microthrixaceae bacterium]
MSTERPGESTEPPTHAETAVTRSGADSPAHEPDRRIGRDRREAPRLSVVTPTFDEADNVVPLLEGIANALAGVTYEVIVVDDDSPDRTWQVAESYATTHPEVRVLRRFSDHGLSSAVMAGFEAARGAMLAVIDADLQHDEAALVPMLAMLESGDADLVVGTRSAEGGSYGDWSRGRRLVSWVATLIARLFLRVGVSDPMSGFFMVTRDAFVRAAPKVNPQGFKILLEFIGRDPALRVREVGYHFRRRVRGETKMSPSVIRSYLLAVFELRLGRQVKGQFVLYSLVGASGVVVNLAVFALLERLGTGAVDVGFSRSVRWSLIGGIAASMVSNFALNNYFTFWEQRFHPNQLWWGFPAFVGVSLLGVVIHVAVYQFLQSNGWGRGVLGAEPTRLLDDGIGYLVALISNYFLNVNYLWRRRSHAP